MIIRKYNIKCKKHLNDPKKVWFIWFYRETCMFCVPIHSVWTRLEKYVVKNKKNINLAKIESQHINLESLGFDPKVKYVPYFIIRYYNSKGKPVIKVQDSRDLESMIKIINKYST